VPRALRAKARPRCGGTNPELRIAVERARNVRSSAARRELAARALWYNGAIEIARTAIPIVACVSAMIASLYFFV
jgi:hypothetical protein